MLPWNPILDIAWLEHLKEETTWSLDDVTVKALLEPLTIILPEVIEPANVAL